MCLDEVGDLLLDMRPDRGLLRAVRLRCGRAAQLAQILHRNDHRQIELLARGRLDDLHLALRREVARHLVHRPHRRRQADPPGRPRQQLVEPLQGHGEMRAPLGPRNGVDLVQDHGFDARQRVPRRRGEHQEQRLRSRDQDVRGLGGQSPALGGRGVARPDADADLRLGQPQPHRLLADTGERAAEIALHIDRQRLERRHVQHAAAHLRVGGRGRGRQLVQGGEKGRQRLAGPGRRHDQHVRAFLDGLPGPHLRGGGRAEGPREPATGRGGEGVECSPGHATHRAPDH